MRFEDTRLIKLADGLEPHVVAADFVSVPLHQELLPVLREVDRHLSDGGRVFA